MLRTKLYSKKIFMLFSNGALYQTYIYKYNLILYIPISLVDKLIWKNKFIKKKEVDISKFVW